MSAEITNNNTENTYWIITDGISYGNGLTKQGQVTTVGNGWNISWIGTDHNEYLNKCNELNIVPRNIEGTEGLSQNPSRVSARQIRLWLVQHGVDLNQIEYLISNIEDPLVRETVKIEWEYAPYVERSHPWLIPLAQSLGLNEEQIDQAFREASII
jgi:hypothetical protein